MVERFVLLRTIDSLWVEHLTEIDDMRRGIGLRGYAQQDPLNEFRKEAFQLYEELGGFIRHQVASTIFRVTITRQPAPPTGVFAMAGPGQAAKPAGVGAGVAGAISAGAKSGNAGQTGRAEGRQTAGGAAGAATASGSAASPARRERGRHCRASVPRPDPATHRRVRRSGATTPAGAGPASSTRSATVVDPIANLTTTGGGQMIQVLRLLLGLGLAIALVTGWAVYRITAQGNRDERRQADAIVVLGAAQFDGTPVAGLRGAPPPRRRPVQGRHRPDPHRHGRQGARRPHDRGRGRPRVGEAHGVPAVGDPRGRSGTQHARVARGRGRDHACAPADLGRLRQRPDAHAPGAPHRDRSGDHRLGIPDDDEPDRRRPAEPQRRRWSTSSAPSPSTSSAPGTPSSRGPCRPRPEPTRRADPDSPWVDARGQHRAEFAVLTPWRGETSGTYTRRDLPRSGSRTQPPARATRRAQGVVREGFVKQAEEASLRRPDRLRARLPELQLRRRPRLRWQLRRLPPQRLLSLREPRRRPEQVGTATDRAPSDPAPGPPGPRTEWTRVHQRDLAERIRSTSGRL